MTVEVVSALPSITVVRAGDRQLELPTEFFPEPPRPGQTWKIALTHLPTNAEQLEELNDYLNPA